MTKEIRVGPCELVWLSNFDQGFLELARDKGFPVKGSFILQPDMDKIKNYTTHVDHSTEETVIKWEEFE
jgi:hypothetical protein